MTPISHKRHSNEVSILLALSKASPRWCSAREVCKLTNSKTVCTTDARCLTYAHCVESRKCKEMRNALEFRIIKYGEEAEV